MAPSALTIIRSQLFVHLPYPTEDLTGQTFIVTGANIGLGLEAARHLVRLNADKVILGVRSVDKGRDAKTSIEQSTGRENVVEVWPLDLSSYQSVKSFAERCKGLDRLDAVIENAGISTLKWAMTEEDESTITTNVVSTFLLALLLVPTLRKSAAQHGIRPRLVVVTSEMHEMARFLERKSDKIFATLSDKSKARMMDRYPVSKLLEILAVRTLADQLKHGSSPPDVIVNCVNPGMCYSGLTRDMGAMRLVIGAFRLALARTTEVGSRTLVHAALSGEESHGQYLTDCHVARWVIFSQPSCSSFECDADTNSYMQPIALGALQRRGADTGTVLDRTLGEAQSHQPGHRARPLDGSTRAGRR